MHEFRDHKGFPGCRTVRKMQFGTSSYTSSALSNLSRLHSWPNFLTLNTYPLKKNIIFALMVAFQTGCTTLFALFSRQCIDAWICCSLSLVNIGSAWSNVAHTTKMRSFHCPEFTVLYTVWSYASAVDCAVIRRWLYIHPACAVNPHCGKWWQHQQIRAGHYRDRFQALCLL